MRMSEGHLLCSSGRSGSSCRNYDDSCSVEKESKIAYQDRRATSKGLSKWSLYKEAAILCEISSSPSSPFSLSSTLQSWISGFNLELLISSIFYKHYRVQDSFSKVQIQCIQCQQPLIPVLRSNLLQLLLPKTSSYSSTIQNQTLKNQAHHSHLHPPQPRPSKPSPRLPHSIFPLPVYRPKRPHLSLAPYFHWTLLSCWKKVRFNNNLIRRREPIQRWKNFKKAKAGTSTNPCLLQVGPLSELQRLSSQLVKIRIKKLPQSSSGYCNSNPIKAVRVTIRVINIIMLNLMLNPNFSSQDIRIPIVEMKQSMGTLQTTLIQIISTAFTMESETIRPSEVEPSTVVSHVKRKKLLSLPDQINVPFCFNLRDLTKLETPTSSSYLLDVGNFGLMSRRNGAQSTSYARTPETSCASHLQIQHPNSYYTSSNNSNQAAFMASTSNGTSSLVPRSEMSNQPNNDTSNQSSSSSNDSPFVDPRILFFTPRNQLDSGSSSFRDQQPPPHVQYQYQAQSQGGQSYIPNTYQFQYQSSNTYSSLNQSQYSNSRYTNQSSSSQSYHPSPSTSPTSSVLPPNRSLESGMVASYSQPPYEEPLTRPFSWEPQKSQQVKKEDPEIKSPSPQLEPNSRASTSRPQSSSSKATIVLRGPKGTQHADLPYDLSPQDLNPKPPASDFATKDVNKRPIDQSDKIRHTMDRYTPKYVRGSGAAREGFCSLCPGDGKWLRLKVSRQDRFFDFRQVSSASSPWAFLKLNTLESPFLFFDLTVFGLQFPPSLCSRNRFDLWSAFPSTNRVEIRLHIFKFRTSDSKWHRRSGFWPSF